MKLKISQWNANHMKTYGWDYFQKHTKDSDVCILQRIMTDELWNLDFEHVHCAGQGYGDDVSIVIASNIMFDDARDIDLPSRESLKKGWDKHQGGKAVSVVINDMQIVSALPCHDCTDECCSGAKLTKDDTWHDMKYLFDNITHKEKCLIGADFHMPALTDPTHESLIQKNNFTSHADDLITFMKKGKWGNSQPTQHGINLDRVLTRGDIQVSDLESFAVATPKHTHWLLNYNVNF
ncbi:MAG: hypothetical protein CBD16_07550 [Betaproteobacteria bacterium TMED156]|nr:MAG: hypothetical protein CBD16_07550 [Betaproteobacteria bacterium TMED156]